MISEMFQALKAGEQLKNSEGWKNVQITTNAVAAILAGVLSVLALVGFHPPITTEEILAIAGGIAGVLGVFNSYTTTATSATVGLPPAGGTGVPDGPHPSRDESAP